MINAALINFVAFSHFDATKKGGEVAALFIVVLAVCASVVGLVILMKVYKHFEDFPQSYLSDVNTVQKKILL